MAVLRAPPPTGTRLRGDDAASAGMLAKVRTILTPAEQKRGLVVLLFMLVLALLETGGVASVMPFLAVLGNPALVETNPFLASVYRRGGFVSTDRFLFTLGVGSFLLVVVTSVFRVAATYVSNRYVQMRRYSISYRLLRVYLRQPYEFFLDRNSADLSKSVLSEADAVANQVVKPLMDILSAALVILVIVSLLVVVDPRMAAGIATVVGGLYAAVYLGVRGLLHNMGSERVAANRARFQAAGEAFGGIKDLKILGRERGYLRRFKTEARRLARFWYVHATVSAVPRYLIEAVGFGGILALALMLMATRQDLGEVLPLLGLYAFGAYRMLPAAQQFYASLGTLRFGGPALDVVYDDLVQEEKLDWTTPPAGGGVELAEGICFEALSFRYPNAEGDALHGIDLSIPAGSTVGFVGATGAGKTTAVDLLLGLLLPSGGRILIDGRPMEELGVKRWQRSLGYVPQSIYLADVSVAQNIAFGVDPGDIDQEAVRRAARIAKIDQFIVEQLPKGYETEVGDRGIRLSGGQRQRIGIARALYHDPSVLVFDEATSALDTATERAVMEAVEELSGEKTIVMIAHRLSTVERCDRVFVLDAGRLGGVGTFEELKRSNPAFQRLAVA